MKRLLLLLTIISCCLLSWSADRRNFDHDWLFTLGDEPVMADRTYDDTSWRRLQLPHDWAIEGDFQVTNPSGASGGALPGGIGWYRKHFRIDEGGRLLWSTPSSQVFIEFDGVYMNATVYVNGQEVGHRPYGYSSFEYDITPFLLPDGDNVIAVRVDNGDQPNSRWYSGCGIYRHVWLTNRPRTHIAHWGVHTVPTLQGRHGRLDVDVTIEGDDKVSITHELLNANGEVVATASGRQASMKVKQPRLWSTETPYLYMLRTNVISQGKVVDQEMTTVGFRSFRFDAETGFWLNGRNMKLNGVCEHHDFGCLGAALYEDALHRKLTKLKAMGVNAIRSTHNPPAPELLQMCDSMGLIVMDESFDMWRRKKTQNDYARFFDEWHERDLTDLVLRDRNHPCVLMWSIGNEVLEQWSSAEADTLTLEQANLILNAGHDASSLARDGELSVNSLLTRHLADIVKRYDTSRPITAGCNEPDPGNHLFKSGALDVIGYNYHHQWLRDVKKHFPGKPFLFSESISALQTRGFYMMPSDSCYVAPREWWLPYTDPSFKCSAYDNMHASWSSTHENGWSVVKHHPYVSGQFIWTGFDYIGEPTPYAYPARSSYFGVIDLAGFPKDSYYMYQSEWTDQPVLHLFPHWNWLPGQEIDLWCYYNQADEVELFVNGKSQGVRRKLSYEEADRMLQAAETADPSASHEYQLRGADGSTEFHTMWRVRFEPGEVTVVARKGGQNGLYPEVVAKQTIRTAGAPHHIRLSVDYQGKDLTFVTAEVVDEQGTLCPNATNQLFFDVDDEMEILGVDNGSQTSLERFKDNKREAFFGKCMVVVRGRGVVRAQAVDLQAAAVKL